MPRRGWSLRTGAKGVLGQLGLENAKEKGLLREAINLQATWKDVLNTPGRGKTYPAGLAFITTHGSPRMVVPVQGSPGNPSRAMAHTASAPGDPPAPDRGDLRRAVMVERDGESVRVGMGGKIGRRGLALEYGVNTAGSKVGRHPGVNMRIDPRPHARPAKDAWAQKKSEGFRAALKVGVRPPALLG